MKWAPICAVTGAFLLGAVAGAISTKDLSSRRLPDSARYPARELPTASSSARPLDKLRIPESRSSSPLPTVLAGEMTGLTPRRRALRIIFDHIPPEKVQSALSSAVWGNPARERRALELFKETKDPADLEILRELLSCISDPVVRADLTSCVRNERDPLRRRVLAAIVGSIWQFEDFTPLLLELMEDPDPEVIRAALKETWLSRSNFDKDPELKRRAAELMRAAASAGKPNDLRAQALRSMRGTTDPDDARFLIDIALRDRSGEIVVAAICSFPDSFELRDQHRPLVVEMIRVLYAIATDTARPLPVRQSAAISVDMMDWNDEDKILTPGETSVINEIRSLPERE